jgi:hypothetical protein
VCSMLAIVPPRSRTCRQILPANSAAAGKSQTTSVET